MKTDRLDAIKLGRYLKTGILTAVTVPDIKLERDRDLIRFRFSQVGAVTRIKQQILAYLLRHKISYEHDRNWSNGFINQLYKLPVCSEDRQMLDRYLSHYLYLKKFLEELTGDIEELSQTARYRERVAILRGFRGIETLTAMTILTNIPDFRTFTHPKRLCAYVGVTPSEMSSGDGTRRGGITKTGNTLLRKAVISAAQHYSHAQTTSAVLRRRREGLPSSIISIVQSADRRLRKPRLFSKQEKSTVDGVPENCWHGSKENIPGKHSLAQAQ